MEKKSHFKRNIAILLAVLVIIAIIVLISAPVMAKTYYEIEPYTATETYTESEPYTAMETYYEKEPYTTSVPYAYEKLSYQWANCVTWREDRVGQRIWNKDSQSGLFRVHFYIQACNGYEVNEDATLFLNAGETNAVWSAWQGLGVCPSNG